MIGSGGREHAIAWALSRSSQAGVIYVAPGNAGTSLSGFQNIPIHAEDIPALLQFAQSKRVGLTVVGPEVPLSTGIVDRFQAMGLHIFGPCQAAAQLESSKAFAKEFMIQHGIPTAHYARFDAYPPAVAWVRAIGKPVVVKADGLAAGKGVVLCDSVAEAETALRACLLEGIFGEAGRTVVVEERLSGPELSVLAFSDGHSILVMPNARDHKRVFDGDAGPNTGGMGAFAPVPEIADDLIDQISRTVLQPAIDGMARRGSPYIGVLYAGLMLTASGPKTLEFNCRFGDPETQAILPLLKSDMLDIIQSCTEGRLESIMPDTRWHSGACATVVLASGGYPGNYAKGLPIDGLDRAAAHPDVFVFHAGTSMSEDRVVTAGGRVLTVSALGTDLPTALQRAYLAASEIHFEGMHYRKDIGRTSL